MNLDEAAKLIGEYADKHKIEHISWHRYDKRWSAWVYENIKSDNTSYVGDIDENVTTAIKKTAERYKDKLRDY